MYVYLTAGADDNYDASAYAYIVANFPVRSERHRGWTVVEAYLHGLLDLSNFIISKDLYRHVTGFVICTPSQLVINITEHKYLEQLQDIGWKNPNGGYLFHSTILKELYYHHVFYKEREIKWISMTSVGEMEYKLFERCQEQVEKILKGG